jgi:predicted N-acetyltransferase YhbS
MGITLRTATAYDLSAISELANRVFRAHRPGQRMPDEFPYLYDPTNAQHWYIATDADRLVSIVGAMVWPAVIAGTNTRVASVGSVATDPDYRRQGLAGQLLSLAQSRLMQESVRIMLISGSLPIYQRWGARAVGKVEWYAWTGTLAPIPYQVRPIHPIDDAVTVATLYQTRSTRFGRTLSQLQTMLQTQPITTVEQGMKVAQLVSDGGRPVSYFIVNHRPFHGQEASRLIEWGGDPKSMLCGLNILGTDPSQTVHIPVLYDDLALRGQLDPMRPFRVSPVSWLAKIIDGVGLFQDLSRLIAELAAKPFKISEAATDQYRLTWPDGDALIDAATLTEWTFGHNPTTRPSALDAVFPLPALWTEGLNYI